MKKTLLSLALVASLVFGGCTSVQTQTVETDIAKVLQVAIDTVDQLQSPAGAAAAEAALSSLAAIAPQTGPIHQAIVDAQAALNALQSNKGSVDQAQAALQVVVNLLEQQGTVPVGAIRHKAGLKKPAAK